MSGAYLVMNQSDDVRIVAFTHRRHTEYISEDVPMRDLVNLIHSNQIAWARLLSEVTRHVAKDLTKAKNATKA